MACNNPSHMGNTWEMRAAPPFLLHMDHMPLYHHHLHTYPLRNPNTPSTSHYSCVCICVYVCVCVYVCMCIYISVFSLYICVSVSIYVYVCMCVCVYVCMCVYVCICVYVYMCICDVYVMC